MRILKVNIYRGNVYVKAQNKANPTSVVLYCPFCGSNGEFERFGGFYVDCYSRYNRRQGRKAHFRPLQRQANFHQESRIARLPNQTLDKVKG